MESAKKIIFLKTSSNVYSNTFDEKKFDKNTEPIISKENLGNKALNILKEIEELWEMNHNSLELRGKFHLLRYYLKGLTA